MSEEFEFLSQLRAQISRLTPLGLACLESMILPAEKARRHQQASPAKNIAEAVHDLADDEPMPEFLRDLRRDRRS